MPEVRGGIGDGKYSHYRESLLEAGFVGGGKFVVAKHFNFRRQRRGALLTAIKLKDCPSECCNPYRL